MCVYIYIYTHTYYLPLSLSLYIYIYVQRESLKFLMRCPGPSADGSLRKIM